MRNTIPFLVVVLMSSFLLSCGSKKTLNKSKAFRKADAGAIYANLAATQPDYTWYNGKARVRASSDAMRVSGTVHLRMLKDSLIWLRIEKFGFEVGRTLIRPDSVFVIDRINKEYSASTTADYLEYYQVPFSFYDVQNILAGGAVLFEAELLKAETMDDEVRLTFSNDTLKALYRVGPDLELTTGTIRDLLGRSVDYSYEDYRKLDRIEILIPFDRNIIFNDGESFMEASFEFSQIEFDVAKSMKFEIPRHYDKVD